MNPTAPRITLPALGVMEIRLAATATRQKRRRRRFAATVAALGFGVVTLAGCSSGEPAGDPGTDAVSPSPDDVGDAATRSPLDSTAQKIEALVGEESFAPTTETLPDSPTGFTDAEVTAFAERAIDLVTRGVAPGLTDMSPSAAFKYVFANQYPATTASSRRAVEAVAGRYDWEWGWASRFESEPTTPARFLASHWQVETDNAQLSDGTSDKILRLTLSVAVEHLVPDKARDSTSDDVVIRPIVMQRTVIVQGFRPQGGPKWWPGIGVQARPLFGGQCAPVIGSVLTPATSREAVERDFKRLSAYLEAPKRVDANDVSEASDLTELVDKYCDD